MSELAAAAEHRPGILRRAYAVATSDKISLTSAGCAFYATLALFPLITMLISIYGLVFDPVTVEPQLEAVRGLLPRDAVRPLLR